MPVFYVTYESTIREVYRVEAVDAEAAEAAVISGEGEQVGSVNECEGDVVEVETEQQYDGRFAS